LGVDRDRPFEWPLSRASARWLLVFCGEKPHYRLRILG
jgi:hypothetical protein